jgi:UrcA family protein
MTNRNLTNAFVCAGYAALSAIALTLTVPAAAQETRQERVVYSDLDLTGEAGQAALGKRIQGAVKRVCRPAGSTVAEMQEWNRCKRASLASANRQMQVAIAKANGSRTGIAALTFGSPTAEKR